MYLDLKKQKRTLEQNEFTIDASSEEAKAFFTAKQASQELVIDLENKSTYFEEYQLQEDGTRYSHYKDTQEEVDNVLMYVADIGAVEAEKTKAILDEKLAIAHEYLSKTDHKFFNGYKPKDDEDLVEIEAERDANRMFIRENKEK